MHERHLQPMFVRMELHVQMVLYETNDIVDTSDIVETTIKHIEFTCFYSKVPKFIGL
jgi:hypothetical protein